MKKLNTIALISIIGILISCEHKKEENKWDWKNITGNINTSGLTTIYMLDEEIGYVGGFSNIETKKTINHYSGSFKDSILLKPNEHYLIDANKVTMDGGITWTSLEFPLKDELNLENIVFYYYYEDNIVRVIPKTAYHKMTIEVNTYIKDLFFPSRNIGFAIGTSHVLKFNN
jgi:hypothetical protein